MIPQVCPWFDDDEIEAVTQTINANWVTEGPQCAEFGAGLNKLVGTEYGVFAPNGTLALFLGLLALGIGAEDEVLVPDTTFVASANAVILAGGKPVFVDVNDYNFQMDIGRCEEALSPKTWGVMPVHLYGMAMNMRELMQWARQHSLFVIEDAAEAVGVKYKGQHAGTFGDVGCFSFFADKTITTGEGGYVICNDEQIYERLLFLRNQGRLQSGTFIHPEIGFNFRITDLQAAIGLMQLRKLSVIIERKRAVLGWYRERLKDIEQVDFLKVEPGSDFVPFRVVLICERAHNLMDCLARQDIQVRTFFYPLHRQPCFASYAADDANFPNAIYGYEHGICLPVFPALAKNQVAYICSKIGEFYAG